MFNTILGLTMLYSFVHSVVICFKHLKDLTTYQKVVLWFAFISMSLVLIGVMMGN
jgi:hypothetical protein